MPFVIPLFPLTPQSHSIGRATVDSSRSELSCEIVSALDFRQDSHWNDHFRW